jgi:hypothetical protein
LESDVRPQRLPKPGYEQLNLKRFRQGQVLAGEHHEALAVIFHGAVTAEERQLAYQDVG